MLVSPEKSQAFAPEVPPLYVAILALSMGHNHIVSPRKDTQLTDWLTAEGVVAFYHNNAEKARAAIAEAVFDGRFLQALT